MVWFEIKLLPNAEIEVGNFYSIFSSLEEDMRFYILPGPRFIVFNGVLYLMFGIMYVVHTIINAIFVRFLFHAIVRPSEANDYI